MGLVISKGLTLRKEFQVQPYMWEFPQQYGLWSPAEISTALWLDAADASTITESSGAVSQWNDKSGYNYHATQPNSGNRPVYNSTGFNSKGSINFTRSSVQHLITPAITGNGISGLSLTAIQVIKPGTGWGTGNSTFMSSIGTRASNGSWWSFIRNSDNNEIGFHGSAQYWSGSSLGTNAAILIDVVSSGSTHNAWRSGTQIGEVNRSIAAFTANNNVSLSVGAGSFVTTAEAYLGDIMEVVLVTSAISTDIRQRIEGYLAHKWGLTASLPSDHPYKTVGPTP
jgi:hypothetical protein